MNEPETTVTIEFTIREARALRNSGALFANAVPDDLRDLLPDDGKVRALDSAVMRLETALVCEGAEL